MSISMGENTSKSRYSLYKGYNFQVEIDGMSNPISFRKVSSIERGIETETCQIGGLNARVHSLASAIGSERILTCERGVMSKDDQEVFETLTDSISCDLAVAILDDAGNVVRYYELRDCMLKTIRLGDLDASVSDILIETLEFVYGDMEMIAG
ncbi:MAG: phage tail protein [Eubacteriales bacterium]